MALTKAHNRMIDGAAINVFDYMSSSQISDVTSNTGSVDVSSAIQSAIDDASTAGGKVVKFPSGTYLCDSVVNIKSNCTLLGDSFRNTILKTTKATQNLLSALNQDNFTISDLYLQGANADGVGNNLICSGCSNIEIESVTSNQSAFSGIYAASSTNVSITNCRAVNSGQFGINLNDVTYGRVINNLSTGSGQFTALSGGIAAYDCTYVSIQGNDAYSNSQFGIELRDTAQAIIDSNTCHSNGTGSVGCGIAVQRQDGSVARIVISNNVCRSNDEHGIVVQGNNLTDQIQQISITGNTCAENGDDTEGKGIYLASYITNASITGNVCNKNDESGIEVTAKCERVSISGNVCVDNGQAAGSSASGIRVFTESTEGQANTKLISITGNTCTNQDGVTQEYGVSLEVTSGETITQSLVVGNILVGNNTSSLLDNGTTTTKGNNLT